MKPEELQAIRERLNAEMRMTQIGRREMWQLAFEDVPRLLDEIERLRSFVDAVSKGQFANQWALMREARRALDGDTE